MKTIVLSDHAVDMIAKERGLRQQQYDSSLNSYRDAERKWSREVNAEYQKVAHYHQQELDRWSKMSWFRRLLYGLAHSWPATLLCVAVMGAGIFGFFNGFAPWLGVVGLAVVPGVALFYFPGQEPSSPSRASVERRAGHVPQRPVHSTARTEAESVWEAGAEGERKVSDQLAAQLDSQWTMLAGYSGPGGEIDRILVGPLGACALEVKFLNGSVTVDGDNWTMTRYDNYGNIVDHGVPVSDKSGQSPSGQVNRAVKPLEDFLRQRTALSRMARAVVLSHDKSNIHRVKNKTLDHVSTLRLLKVRELFSRSKPLDAGTAAKVVQHIQRDHEFHKNRRSRSRKKRPASRNQPTT